MDNFHYHMLSGLHYILASKPVMFLFNNSLAVGILTGSISLIPFILIRRLPTLIVNLIVMLISFYIYEAFNLTIMQFMYSVNTYFIANFFGNYIVGFIFGCVIANLIQRIRGEHHHAAND